jgi:hypothetical protein
MASARGCVYVEHDVHVSRRLTQAITRRRALQAVLATSGLALVGCSSATSLGGDPAAEEFLAWPAEDRWPELFYKASERIQETYRSHELHLRGLPRRRACRDDHAPRGEIAP